MSDFDLETICDGYLLPVVSHEPTAQQLFLYAASTWNAHRIHYDGNYATGTEKYDDVVIQGPLIADFFTQAIVNWLQGRGRIASFRYSNRAVSFLGDTLTSRISVESSAAGSRRLELVGHVENVKGEIVLPGTATVEW